MVRINQKLKGFTIVETVFAALIITISFGVGMSIYLNILSSENLEAKTNAAFILDDFMQKTITLNDWKDKRWEIEGLSIIREVEPINRSAKVYKVELTAILNQRILHQHNLIVRDTSMQNF